MSSSTSDLSLFSSFEKESTDQPTLGLATAASNLSGPAADTAIPRPGIESQIGCKIFAVLTGFVVLQLLFLFYLFIIQSASTTVKHKITYGDA